MSAPKIAQNVSNFYDAVLPDYLEWSKSLNIHFGYIGRQNLLDCFSLSAMLESMNHQIADRLDIEDNNEFEILDAGCGAGATCISIKKKYPSVKLTGINLSKSFIDFGNKSVSYYGFTKDIKLLESDFTKTNFPEESFDKVYAIESVCYDKGASKTAFITEMNRVMKRNGRMVIADGFKRHMNPLPIWLDNLNKKNLAYWGIDELPIVEPFINELKESNFRITSVEDISWNVAPSSIYLIITAIKLIFKRLFAKKGHISTHQNNYIKALFLTFFLGLFQKHFGYFIITAEKR